MDWLEYQVHMDHPDQLEYLVIHQMPGLYIQDGGEHHVTVMLYCYIKVRDSIIVLEKSIYSSND